MNVELLAILIGMVLLGFTLWFGYWLIKKSGNLEKGKEIK